MNKNVALILSVCGLFLFYKYIAQLFPALIANDLLQSRGYDGVMLAVMASSYYYAYTFMQIGAGLIIDRYHIKVPMVLAILCVSMMILLFTHTTNFYLMCLSRAMMGVGASFATVLYMKCAANYTQPKTFGVMSSLLATATMLGAACGATPVGMLFHYYGWQQGLNILATCGVFLAFAVLLFKEDESSTKHVNVVALKWSGLKTVLTKKDNLLLLLYSGFTFSPLAILGGLWGTPFIMAKYHLSVAHASVFLSLMFIGHALGSPLWAFIALRTQMRQPWMHLANVLAFAALMLILYGPLTYGVSLFLFFVFGFSVGCFMLSFELCRAMNGVALMGLSVAFINSGEGLLSTIIEPAIGHLLDLSQLSGTLTLANYQYALSMLPCCFVLSSLVLHHVGRNISLAPCDDERSVCLN